MSSDQGTTRTRPVVSFLRRSTPGFGPTSANDFRQDRRYNRCGRRPVGRIDGRRQTTWNRLAHNRRIRGRHRSKAQQNARAPQRKGFCGAKRQRTRLGDQRPHMAAGGLSHQPAHPQEDRRRLRLDQDIAGQEQTKFRGRVGWAFTFASVAYNLVRLPKPMATPI